MRWKLAVAHYLHTVAKNQWEYIEMDRKTGRPKRHLFTVPRYLNPLEESDQNSVSALTGEGEIIVCREGLGEPADIEFVGTPTPDMIPLDDEARAESAKFESAWSYHPGDIPEAEGGYAASIVEKLSDMRVAVDVKPVEIPGMTELIAAITAQSTMIGQLVAAQASAPSPRSTLLNRT